jgi:hypothetical protein
MSLLYKLGAIEFAYLSFNEYSAGATRQRRQFCDRQSFDVRSWKGVVLS